MYKNSHMMGIKATWGQIKGNLGPKTESSPPSAPRTRRSADRVSFPFVVATPLAHPLAIVEELGKSRL